MTAVLALAMQVAAQPAVSRHRVSQVGLNAMADACHAPRAWLHLKDREVIFRGSPDADFNKVKCVLEKVSKVVSMTNIGFVGNAQASDKK